VKSVVIIGAGGFGREVLEIFKDQNKISKRWNILGFLDENKQLHGKTLNGYPVLGGLDWLREHNNDNLGCVVAIGTCEIRKLVVKKLQKVGVNFYNAVHPSVIMSDSVEMGTDVIICAGSILTVNIKIGDHVHINLNCTIGHDAVIGSYCTINPIAAINGNNHLGEGVYVGSGATFIQAVSIGSWSTIGAGAVVTVDIPEKVTAVGVPAKVIKSKDQGEHDILKR
jgi:sugar O-acyltransferase (sialic acid O-acetyltransferase NeuD family)